MKMSGVKKFKQIEEEFTENYELLSEKGVYFYDYASSFSVFSEKNLPAKLAFYSKLREEDISDVDFTQCRTSCHIRILDG